MTGVRNVGSRRVEMSGVKIALLIVAAILVGALVIGIVVANLRFFLWVGLIGLIILVIYQWATTRHST
jgi:hypothetical protein